MKRMSFILTTIILLFMPLQAIGQVALNKPLKAELETIFYNDQKYRLMTDSVRNKFGQASIEMKDLWKIISSTDSINIIRVKEIIKEFGWPGKSLVGKQANTAVWAVIQHSDIATQEEYLPLLKESVEIGESEGYDLALLEDRILIRNGKKQIYGSQVHRNELTGLCEFFPIEDEKNVNQRRAKVGLEPIEEYAKIWNIEYKLSEQ